MNAFICNVTASRKVLALYKMFLELLDMYFLVLDHKPHNALLPAIVKSPGHQTLQQIPKMLIIAHKICLGRSETYCRLSEMI